MKGDYDVYDVFTPSQPAELTFVDRIKVNKDIVDALRTPGRQLVVFGYTGCGKSSLVANKLNQLYENVILSQCTSSTTVDDLKLHAFDSLNSYYSREKSNSNKTSKHVKFSSTYFEIKGAKEKLSTEKLERIVPPQLTDQKLAELIGEVGACWVIEDFHKVEKEQKKLLSQILKVFVDASKRYKSTKIIAIGAVDSGKEVVEYDNEMKDRISEIPVPLMSFKELNEIMTKGEQLMNIEIDNAVKNKIKVYSNGLASVCHQLCLYMCTNNGIYSVCKRLVKLDEGHLKAAIEDYLKQNSASLKANFNKSIKTTSKKAKPAVVVKAILQVNKEEFSSYDVEKVIEKDYDGFPKNAVQRILKEFCKSKRQEMLRYNEDNKTYFFSNPFQRAYVSLFFKDETNRAIELGRISPEMIMSYVDAIRDMREIMGDHESIPNPPDPDLLNFN